MKIFAKLFCWIRGHDMINEWRLDNAACFDGIPRSYWGRHRCLRCSRVEDWQYDL